jgi:mono/diheme cytochrome c family protein
VKHLIAIVAFVFVRGLLHQSFGASDLPDDKFFRSFVKTHCIDCHGPEKQKGDVRFDKLSDNPAADSDLWLSVLEQLEAREMPPKKKPQPSDKEVLQLLEWIDVNVSSARRAFREKMQRPENGNLVAHDKLFDPKVAAQAPKIAASPARVWRTLPQSYEQKQEAWLKARGVNVAMKVGQAKTYSYLPAPFGLHTKAELKNYSFRYSLAGSQTEGLANNARSLLDLVIKANPGGRPKDLIRKMARAKEPPKPEDVDQIVVEQYRHWLGRDPEGPELEQRRKKILDRIEKFGNRDGLILGLVPIMISPEVFFHTEFGNVDVSGEPAFLSPTELIDAVNRALRDRRSHGDRRNSQWQMGYGKPIVRDFLVVAASNGKLKNREDLAAALDKAVNHKHVPKLSQSATVKRFLDEYFNYTQYFDVFKCVADLQREKDAGRLAGAFIERFNNGYPEIVVSRTRGFIGKILEEDRQVLARLLTIKTDYRGDSKATMEERFQAKKVQLKKGIENSEKRLAKTGKQAESEKQRANLARNLAKNKRDLATLLEKHPDWMAPERIGVLTQRSWLVSHSSNVENDPIHRGKWIRERLLGGRVPDVPITVDAQIPENAEKTLRERMQRTRGEECWKCHRLMDPLGLPFEQFDHFGSLRKTEKERPVVVTGAIINSGVPALDGPVAGPEELIKKLAASEHVQQVFVRHAFRFWMGRNETLEDARILQDAYRAYKESEGSMSALLKSLLTSDAFLYRTGANPKGVASDED